ncbi:MAG: hypothetical protein WDN04_15805 [Rhodospirillales bacterium]
MDIAAFASPRSAAPVAQSATRPPRYHSVRLALLAISGAGSLSSAGLLIAGDPATALRAFSGSVLLLLALILANRGS